MKKRLEEKKNTKEEKKLRKSKEVVYKNKVQKEFPKKRKYKMGKCCWEKEREKDKWRKKIQKESLF